MHLDRFMRFRRAHQSTVPNTKRGLIYVRIRCMRCGLKWLLSADYNTTRDLPAVDTELSMGPFSVTQPNATHQLTDPTQPNTASNGAYSLVVTYFYAQNLSVSRTCQIGRNIKFNCLAKPNLI